MNATLSPPFNHAVGASVGQKGPARKPEVKDAQVHALTWIKKAPAEAGAEIPEVARASRMQGSELPSEDDADSAGREVSAAIENLDTGRIEGADNHATGA